MAKVIPFCFPCNIFLLYFFSCFKNVLGVGLAISSLSFTLNAGAKVVLLFGCARFFECFFEVFFKCLGLWGLGIGVLRIL